jgi:hypothetical protein
VQDFVTLLLLVFFIGFYLFLGSATFYNIVLALS